MTRIAFTSDTHNKHYSVKVPECDILCHCGDFSAMGRSREVKHFMKWLISQHQATHKVFIAGNHDISFANPELRKQYMESFYGKIYYLEDSEVILEGLKIYGSPWSAEFYPDRWAFNLPRNSDKARATWGQIPEDTDILLTHGPPHGILDRCKYPHPKYPSNGGCEVLRDRVEEIQPLVHAFGHIHEGRGIIDTYTTPGTVYINCAICNLSYEPINRPYIVDIIDETIINIEEAP